MLPLLTEMVCDLLPFTSFFEGGQSWSTWVGSAKYFRVPSLRGNRAKFSNCVREYILGHTLALAGKFSDSR